MPVHAPCPLCHTADHEEMYRDHRRPYRHCPHCNLVFVPPAYFLTAEAEKTQYDFHQNSPTDKRYRQFLNRLFEPMQAQLPQQSFGLDFGSGPGPTLSVMFEEAGHTMALYDRFYAPNTAVFEQQYDFITASEVVEHLQRPWEELSRLWDCLKIGGTLGLMTKLFIDAEAFKTWHYKNDPTHVCFFSRRTFQWLAEQWHTEAHLHGRDVVLFRKYER
ncbi:MAG: class I SAM-dependent methyltransferase [Anaerolineales bacterium]|nr:class I SAM-dependent methyltransferase [Anaerolineales bacterium]